MITTKQQRAQLRAENRQQPKELMEIPRCQWAKSAAAMSLQPIRAFRSRDFLAQIFAEPNGNIRISVNRTDQNKDGTWKDGISWDELQEIKRQIGYGDRLAVEIYPPDRDVVNVANMRHLWVLQNHADLPWWKKDCAA